MYICIRKTNIMKTVTAYHGTDRYFEKFSMTAENRSMGTKGGIWFAKSPIVAESYTACGSYNERYYLRALVNGDIFGNSIGNSSIIKTEISFKNPLIFDANFSDSGNLLNDRENRLTIADLFSRAISEGFDGVIVLNVDDCGSYVNPENKFTTIYGVSSISQINF